MMTFTLSSANGTSLGASRCVRSLSSTLPSEEVAELDGGDSKNSQTPDFKDAAFAIT